MIDISTCQDCRCKVAKKAWNVKKKKKQTYLNGLDNIKC